MINILLFTGYTILIMSIISSFVFEIISLFRQRKNDLVKLFLSIGFISIIFLTSYILSSDEIFYSLKSSILHDGERINSKLIGGGLITTYCLILLAFLVIVYTEIRRVILCKLL
jgi:hypothetical protein